MQNAYYFLQLDLLMAYHQILLREEDRPKTAFLRQKGVNVLKLMPFVLGNGRATLQRLMEGIFRDEVGKDLAGNFYYLLM